MAFTTVARVRSESWFNWNSDISDTYILWYLNQSNGVLLSYVASVYNAWLLVPSAIFTWSQAEQLLIRIEELLTSWYLLISEYWPEALNTDKDWYTKVKEAMWLLDKILSWDLKLFDVNFAEFSKNVTMSWIWLSMTTPDNNTDLTPIFTTSDVY